MSKILIEGNKVIIDGHANDLETCNTLTNLCDELRKSEKFRTVKYESGYGEFESISENKEKKFLEVPEIPPPPQEFGYQVNIKSNDGTTILAQNDDIDYLLVTSVGAQLKGINTDATYTYSGSKLFIGLATSANSFFAKYKPGDTIIIDETTTLYIVENIILPDSYSTLTALFSDIATVIREKTGDASAIVANDFPAMIRESLHGDYDSLETPIIDRTIKEITNSGIETIGNYAFAFCTSLTSVSFSACTRICSSAFQRCFSLTSVSFPKCTSIDDNAFASCPNLTSVSFPVCTGIGNGAFGYCTRLTSVSFQECTDIGNGAFQYCSSLTSVSFPKCTNIGNSVFFHCTSLTSVSLPMCTSIGSYAFQYCTSLTSVSLPMCTRIGNSAFVSCFNLISLTLGAPSVCLLPYSKAFYSTPIGGYSASAGRYGSIFVPASLLASYKAATNWSYFSSRFVGY